ncbi:MAG: hypothetical protein ACXWBN_09585, partial [Acidimicrobiales bacterium]
MSDVLAPVAPRPPRAWSDPVSAPGPDDAGRLAEMVSYLDSAFDRGLIGPDVHDALRSDVVGWLRQRHQQA